MHSMLGPRYVSVAGLIAAAAGIMIALADVGAELDSLPPGVTPEELRDNNPADGSPPVNQVETTDTIPELAEGYEILRLTDDAYFDWAPEIHDGKVVWFCADLGAIKFFDGEQTHTVILEGYQADWYSEPQIHEGQITWVARDAYHEVFLLYDGTNIIQLTDNEWPDGAPHIHSGQVVWQGNPEWDPWRPTDAEIFLYDGNQVSQITDNDYDDRRPRIHDGKIAWLHSRAFGDNRIWLYDGTQTIEISDQASPFSEPRVNEGQAVWLSGNKVLFYDGATVNLLTPPGATPYDHPNLDSGQVVWSDSGKILMYDGVQVVQLAGNEHWSNYSPVVHNGQVAWHGTRGGKAEIFVYNGSQVVQLTDDDRWESEVRIHNGQVVWYHYDGHDGEIFMARPRLVELESITPASQTVCLGAETEFQIETDPAGHYELVSVTVSGSTIVTPYDTVTGRIKATFDELSANDTDYKTVTATLGPDILVAETIVLGLDYIVVEPDKIDILIGDKQQFTAEGWNNGPDGEKKTADDIGPFLLRPYWSASSEIGTIDASGLFTAVDDTPADKETVHGEITARIGKVFNKSNVTVDRGHLVLGPLQIVSLDTSQRVSMQTIEATSAKPPPVKPQKSLRLVGQSETFRSECFAFAGNKNLGPWTFRGKIDRPLSYTWLINNREVYKTPEPQYQNPIWTSPPFTTAGDFKVALKAREVGQKGLVHLHTPAYVLVVDGNIGSVTPDKPATGDRIQFTSTVVPAKAKKIVSYSWDFDDGSPVSTAANPQHAFEKAGTYEIELTLTFKTDYGQKTKKDTKEVTVVQEPNIIIVSPTEDDQLITLDPKNPIQNWQAKIVGVDPDPTATTDFTWKWKYEYGKGWSAKRSDSGEKTVKGGNGIMRSP